MNHKCFFSCVLENTPILKAQAFIWVSTLIHIISVKPSCIYIHIIGEMDESFTSWLDSLEVNLVSVNAFSTENSYCNKLSQLETFVNEELDFDYVFFMDCDTAVFNLESLELNDKVYAKIVDYPYPPHQIIKRVFLKAGLDFKEGKASFPINGNQKTHINNCNGGLYIIAKEFVSVLSPKWKEYANWSLDKVELYTSKYSKHIDQLSFAMAIESLSEKVSHLGLEWNYPLHLNKDILSDIDVNILHFHDQLDQHMHLKKKGLPLVDNVVKEVNATIDLSLKNNLDNSMFWDLRYALYPERGSGVGSRGDVLEFKKSLIKNLTYGRENRTVLDIGCGDLELMKNMSFKNYIGIDVSKEAINTAKRKRPDWNFINARIYDDNIPSADVVMCFDVLIHQSSQEEYEKIVKSAVEKANERLIIGAYNEDPTFSSKITHYHTSIIDEVTKYNKFDEIGIVAKYRDVTVIVATKTNPATKHKRDISAEELNTALKEVKNPDLLQLAVDVSRYYFKFFTLHYPRVFEYSWLLEKLKGINGKKVLDIGAGVCPLPLCLNHWNNKVITVDSHPHKRNFDEIESWNEWGYLDYSRLDSRISSFNIDFGRFNGRPKSYDIIYSISVIEHMPKKVRLNVLRKVNALLKLSGKLLLTIDLVPDSDKLWNRSEDKQVEEESMHGTICSFEKELQEIGFEIISKEIMREVRSSRTDLLFLHIKKIEDTTLSSYSILERVKSFVNGK